MGGTGEAVPRLVCDTNVIVRLLTNLPPVQAKAARRYLARAAGTGAEVFVPDVVVAEVGFVLTSVYGIEQSAAAEAIEGFIEYPAVVVDDIDRLFSALDLWAATSLDFVDAYVGATSWDASIEGVLSFDRDFDKKVLGVTRVDPATR